MKRRCLIPSDGLYEWKKAPRRQNSLLELDWRDVHFDDSHPYIDLSAKIAKRGRKRHVPIFFIPLTINGLPAFQSAWERSLKAAGLWPWSENRLRDSFASYRYEFTGSSQLTAKEAGHSVQVMFDRYSKVVTKDGAIQFWVIRPSL
jgi:integrase